MSKVDTDKPEVATDEEVFAFRRDSGEAGQRILARLDQAEAEVKTATDAHVALAQQFNEKCEDNATLKAEVERLRGTKRRRSCADIHW